MANEGMARILDGFLKGMKEGMLFKRQEEADEALLNIKKEAIAEERRKRTSLSAADFVEFAKENEILPEGDKESVGTIMIPDATSPIGERPAGFKRKELPKDPKLVELEENIKKLRREREEHEKVQRGDFHKTTEGKKLIAKAKVRGFQVADPATQIPTAKDKNEVVAMAGDERAAQDRLNSIIKKLEKGGPTLGLGESPRDLEMQQDITDVKLMLKNLYELGVLTGPDERLIDETLGKPTGPSAVFFDFVKEGSAVERMKKIKDNLRNKLVREAEARGYKSNLKAPNVDFELTPKGEKDNFGATQEPLSGQMSRKPSSSGIPIADEEEMIKIIDQGNLKIESLLR